MVYLLFFYDMGMTMANAALCIVFAALFVRNRSPLHQVTSTHMTLPTIFRE